MSQRPARPTLYVTPALESERIKLLLALKGHPASIFEVDESAGNPYLNQINIDRIYPFLVDQDLAAHSTALDEYIHERWPAPQLLPVDPRLRAYARMLDGWIRQWYRISAQEQRERLSEVESVFNEDNTYFIGHQPTIIDISLRPLLEASQYVPATRAFENYRDRLLSLGTRQRRAA